MKKWRCKVCGEIVEGEHAPEKCPLCKQPAEKFEEVIESEMAWAAEHIVGVATFIPLIFLLDNQPRPSSTAT